MRRLLLILLAGPAFAESPPLTAEQFDALTRGRVMDTYDGQAIYGVEEFLSGRRVVWKDAAGCMWGSWEQVGNQICFDYEDRDDLVCWTYHDAGDRIFGYYQGDQTTAPISLVEGKGPLGCGEFLGA